LTSGGIGVAPALRAGIIGEPIEHRRQRRSMPVGEGEAVGQRLNDRSETEWQLLHSIGEPGAGGDSPVDIDHSGSERLVDGGGKDVETLHGCASGSDGEYEEIDEVGVRRDHRNGEPTSAARRSEAWLQQSDCDDNRRQHRTAEDGRGGETEREGWALAVRQNSRSDAEGSWPACEFVDPQRTRPMTLPDQDDQCDDSARDEHRNPGHAVARIARFINHEPARFNPMPVARHPAPMGVVMNCRTDSVVSIVQLAKATGTTVSTFAERRA